MYSYIALLRGINVSGQRLIKMEQLRQVCTNLGLAQVQSYIQSGNLVFGYQQPHAEAVLKEMLEQTIVQHFGFEVKLVVLSFIRMQEAMEQCPFSTWNPDPAQLYLSFLSGEIGSVDMDKLSGLKDESEMLAFFQDVLYLYCPEGYGKTRLSNPAIERKLKLTATTRNWRTMTQLLKMAQELSY
jgi:uncharacterized protein (DUF1697 family)